MYQVRGYSFFFYYAATQQIRTNQTIPLGVDLHICPRAWIGAAFLDFSPLNLASSSSFIAARTLTSVTAPAAVLFLFVVGIIINVLHSFHFD